jgi:hypothetical protein
MATGGKKPNATKRKKQMRNTAVGREFEGLLLQLTSLISDSGSLHHMSF